MKKTLYVFISIFLSSCVGLDSQVTSFKDPEINKIIKSVAVIVDSSDLKIIKDVEEDFLIESKNYDLEVYKGSAIFSYIKKQSIEDILKKMESKNIQSYLIITGEEDSNSYYVPEKITGIKTVSNSRTNGSIYGYNKYSTNYNQNSRTTYNTSVNTVGGYNVTTLMSNYNVSLYDLETKEKMWFAQIKINSSNSMYDYEDFYKKIVEDVIKKLEEDGLITIKFSV